MTGPILHEEPGAWARSREEAVSRFFDLLDRYAGRRRLPARERCEVLRVRKTDSSWLIYYRARRPARVGREGP